MVNAASPTSDQRSRRRTPVPDAEAATLGAAPLNPFGDLHTLQHLTLLYKLAVSIFKLAVLACMLCFHLLQLILV